MAGLAFRDGIMDRIRLRESRFDEGAYLFVLASLEFGISTFDASAGGLGGCPYAPGAPGNLATGELVQLLESLGCETGVSIEALRQASSFVQARLNHLPGS